MIRLLLTCKIINNRNYHQQGTFIYKGFIEVIEMIYLKLIA